MTKSYFDGFKLSPEQARRISTILRAGNPEFSVPPDVKAFIRALPTTTMPAPGSTPFKRAGVWVQSYWGDCPIRFLQARLLESETGLMHDETAPGYEIAEIHLKQRGADSVTVKGHIEGLRLLQDVVLLFVMAKLSDRLTSFNELLSRKPQCLVEKNALVYNFPIQTGLGFSRDRIIENISLAAQNFELRILELSIKPSFQRLIDQIQAGEPAAIEDLQRVLVKTPKEQFNLVGLTLTGLSSREGYLDAGLIQVHPRLDGCTLEKCHLSLGAVPVIGWTARDSQFESTEFRSEEFRDSLFENCHFSQTVFQVQARNCRFVGCTFTHCDFTRYNDHHSPASLLGCTFENNLPPAARNLSPATATYLRLLGMDVDPAPRW